ncbi:MAG: alpha/beta fold hydrolase [Candidatus Melainabacteria bacterium]|nr:alpha/beta fold hydrolase [Candidatus Melainabacteria bacterium]
MARAEDGSGSLYRRPHEWKMKPLAGGSSSRRSQTAALSSSPASFSSTSIPSISSSSSFPSSRSRSSIPATTVSRNSEPALSAGTALKSWPVPSPRAVILSLHGFGLNKEAFDSFARAMNARGIACYALDLRGFGSYMNNSTGPGGNADAGKIDFYQTILDVKMSLAWLRQSHARVPLFLLGESMGGAVALQTTSMFPDAVEGVIVSVPGDSYYKTFEAASRVAFEVLKPGGGIDLSNHVVGHSTSDPHLKKDWLTDPSARLSISPTELLAFRRFMSRTDELARLINKTPVLMFHGFQDKLSKPDGTLKIFREVGSPDKDLVMLGRAEHLIFEKEQFDSHIVELVRSWIAKHSANFAP